MRRNGVSAIWMLALAAALDAGSAQAGIGVNFDAGVAPLAATDQPGIAPGANWNNVGGSSGSGIGLQDNAGAATTALLTFSSAGASGFTATATANAATNTLYSAGLFGEGFGSEVEITVTDIPYAFYNVFVYASADSDQTNTLSITDGSTIFYYASAGQFNSAATSLLLTTSTDENNPTTGPGQYQVFKGLTSSTFTLLAGGSVADTISNNVFGFQIVEATATVPEPSSWAIMAGLAALGAVVARRRREVV